mmetsp:Transcript_15974/g.33549  ORF Transcript_15974/g.33549 Transcript_15974/m.33549 type:complete len:311 (-) Transcript_15974:222-1154(-)
MYWHLMHNWKLPQEPSTGNIPVHRNFFRFIIIKPRRDLHGNRFFFLPLLHFFQKSAIRNYHTSAGPSRSAPNAFDFSDDIPTLFYDPEDYVPSIQMGGFCRAYEKLRSIRILPSIRHTHHPRPHVLQLEVLIRKPRPINAHPPRPIVIREIPPLNHEPGNNPVEGTPPERQGLLPLRQPLRPLAQLAKVIRGAGDGGAVEPDDDAAERLVLEGDVEVDAGGYRGGGGDGGGGGVSGGRGEEGDGSVAEAAGDGEHGEILEEEGFGGGWGRGRGLLIGFRSVGGGGGCHGSSKSAVGSPGVETVSATTLSG